ncbi:MAG: DUF924 domain-containing protein [Gammaproteobacteria bacterium]|nr:DUF924 domain-containing protein [Gammaproteobacteria bacterium]MCH9764167.1 DUF924 domain-containing protein [Gammaproteobacteria bacterium]
MSPLTFFLTNLIRIIQKWRLILTCLCQCVTSILDALNLEKQDAKIIKQFGRYPHRNSILNRTSSKAE